MCIILLCSTPQILIATPYTNVSYIPTFAVLGTRLLSLFVFPFNVRCVQNNKPREYTKNLELTHQKIFLKHLSHVPYIFSVFTANLEYC